MQDWKRKPCKWKTFFIPTYLFEQKRLGLFLDSFHWEFSGKRSRICCLPFLGGNIKIFKTKKYLFFSIPCIFQAIRICIPSQNSKFSKSVRANKSVLNINLKINFNLHFPLSWESEAWTPNCWYSAEKTTASAQSADADFQSGDLGLRSADLPVGRAQWPEPWRQLPAQLRTACWLGTQKTCHQTK